MTLKGTVEEIHARFHELVSFLAPQYSPPSDAVSVKDGETNGTRYRIYSPKNTPTKLLLPVGVYLHGGGFILGNLDIEDNLCRAVAEHVPSIIVSVDYRLAPEHNCKAQLEDAIKIFEWVSSSSSHSMQLRWEKPLTCIQGTAECRLLRQRCS